MPQLDIFTFFNQLFWFTIVFMCFYFVVLGIVIPKVSFVLKTRAKKLQHDTSSSTVLKAEATSVLSSYDKELLALSGSLLLELGHSFISRSHWLVLDNKLSPSKRIRLVYMHSLVQLFLKMRQKSVSSN